MQVILANKDRLTLTPEQESHEDFQRGLQIGRKRQTFNTAEGLSEAGWIGFWTGYGLDCCRDVVQVIKAFGK